MRAAPDSSNEVKKEKYQRAAILMFHAYLGPGIFSCYENGTEIRDSSIKR